MFRTLIADLEAMLATAKAADLLPRSQEHASPCRQ
jgi:hypothetical protein